jgi:Rieske 2Fe-2S family protein
MPPASSPDTGPVGRAEPPWVPIARAEEVGRDLAQAGAQRAYRLGTEGVLLVRGRDGILRAFSNVCRHRGHELLAPGEARAAGAIKCPYHAWVYRLDGSLAGTSRFGDQPSFDPEAHPLVPLELRERDGWLVVEL